MIGVVQNTKLNQILERVINLPATRSQNDGKVYFQDVVTNNFGNYIIQRAFDKSNARQKALLVEKIKQVIKNAPTSEFTPLKHVLKFL